MQTEPISKITNEKKDKALLRKSDLIFMINSVACIFAHAWIIYRRID